MVQAEKEKFAEITQFLCANAEEIYRFATKKHHKLLGAKHVHEKKLTINKEAPIAIITALANNVEDSKQSREVFEQVGEQIAIQSLAHGLTLEEAIERTLFLKQSMWEMLEQEGLLNTLTVQEFYAFNMVMTTHCDIITANIAYTFHNFSTDKKHTLLASIREYIDLSAEAAQEAQQQLTEMLESITDGFVSYDREWRYVYINAKAAEMTGMKKEELLGKSLFELYPERVDTAIFREYQEVMRVGKPTQLEYFSPGAQRWVRATLYPSAQGLTSFLADITEQKKAEEALKESENNFRQLAEAVPQFVWVNQKDGSLSYVNEQWQRFSGLTPGQTDDNTMLTEIIHPEDSRALFHEWANAFSAGVSFQHEARMKDQDGLYHWFLIRSVPAKDSDGTITQWFGTSTDITELKQVQQQLSESEERFHMMADNIENLAWMAQPDGHIYWYNKRWYDYTGTTPKDMEGWGWQSVHDPATLPDVLKHWTASLQDGKPFGMVFPLKGADGIFRPFLTRVMPVKDTHGEVLHWFGTNTDISDQIKAEEALRKLSVQQEETLALLESLLENAPIGFAFFDKNHRYVRINETLATINGVAAMDHIGKTIEEVLPENAKTVVPVLEKIMKTKEPILDLEVTGETPKEPGATRYWLTSFYPVFIGKSQNVDFIGAVVLEITDRKKLEQQKDEFLAVASHELKTPVTSIKAYAQVLQKQFKKKGDMQSFDFLTKMDGQIDKLITLIADLLDVSKMQAGKLQLRLHNFDFRELVTEIIDEIQRTTTHHTIHTELIESTMVYGDRERIGQVITNFLTNAVKYSPYADIVVVKTQATLETITLCVQDFGLGIAQEKQAKVFERFYRVEGNKENIYPGLGLGLYISREIITRHGGTIWVESVEGNGSTFCFTIPTQKRVLQQPGDSMLNEETITHE